MIRTENDVDDLPQPPRQRGWLRVWPHRIKAFALLTLLAIASALTGIGNAEANTRSRDSVSAGGTLRASTLDAPVLLTAPREQQQGTTGGDNSPPPRALSPLAPSLPRPQTTLIGETRAAENGWVAHHRAGRAARMPTGPPNRLSV